MFVTKYINKYYEKVESENYGSRTVVCNSWEDFDEAIKNIECGLVSPGGTGLPRLEVQRLEREGLIRVFRVWINDKLRECEPVMFRFLYPSKEMYIFIPVDDINRIKVSLNIEKDYSYA